MEKCGKNVKIKPTTSLIVGLKNISIGNDVSIPNYATIFTTDAKLKIGNKVIFGPAPTIITGDHVMNIVGKFIYDIQEKRPYDDKDVIIEDDIWVGANVTILKGVTIGRGSVIAACSLINKDVAPYTIVGGVPARIIKNRFTVEEILEHESKLYKIEDRFSEVELIRLRKSNVEI